MVLILKSIIPMPSGVAIQPCTPGAEVQQIQQQLNFPSCMTEKFAKPCGGKPARMRSATQGADYTIIILKNPTKKYY